MLYGIKVPNKIKRSLKKSKLKQIVSIHSLYEETAGKDCKTTKEHELTLFFIMINGLSSPHLSDPVPASVYSSSTYNLRNAYNIHQVNAGTSLKGWTGGAGVRG